MKVNREIRAPKVRVISHTGEQVGIIPLYEALAMAEEQELDLVEIVPGSVPPVCKIMDFGKFRYDQSKREKENKKATHQIKVKEVKLKPGIDGHDLQTKTRQAEDFLNKGFKVKITCSFRWREMLHPEIGQQIINEMCQELKGISAVESPMAMMGRTLIVILASTVKKKKESSKQSSSTGSAQEDSSKQSGSTGPIQE